ncbi:thiosulfate sulfurtransferase [Burkholderiales bacterium]|nr:MAG: rhodanese-like domain-containing protein [Burkholderiales bacterium]CAG0965709.1 thiosulfate sulfurtransferase [Burkholderiales bacterium]
MSAAKLAAILNQGAAIHLVDVRAAHELAQGRIAGARHLPLAELPQRLAELPADRPVVFYCHSGGRSFQACRFAAAQGHGELYNLDGGIVAWLRAGFELTP